jgi:SSS family solute:Na+ symporter
MGMLAGMQVDFTLLTIILILFLIAGLYSIYGGLASVAWTDVMQVTFLVGGGLITAYAALDVIGSELNIEGGAFGAFGEIFNYFKSIEGDKHFNLVVTRNPAIENITDDPYFDIPGIVVIVGALWLTNLGYWGFNQYIIQKGLAAKSLSEAKKGMIFAAFLKILIPFIVCIPGVCAYYIMHSPDCETLRTTLAGSIERSDDAYPFLIRNFTPVFVKGLSFAALAAAVISSLASMFNSTSTIFTMDIYKHYIDKNASERKLVSVGRITSVCALLMALVAVYPIMGGADQAFQVIQEYSGFVYPGIVVIFGLGLLWKRASGTAAVVAAIGTFAFSILFKFLLPEVPFLLRMGYVFICLVVLFFGLSFMSKKTKPAELVPEKTKRTLFKWAHICLGLAFGSFALGTLCFFNEDCRLLGFEAFFFMAAMMFCIYLYLVSNAKDEVEDIKSIGVDIEIFKTDRTFNIGAACVIIILVFLYWVLW